MDQKIKNIALAMLYLSIAMFFVILLLALKEGGELFREVHKAESAQRIELMRVTQAQIEASESLLTTSASFASGAFLLSGASNFESAKSAVAIMDGSIQQAKNSEMANVATVMEALKIRFLQDMGLDELRYLAS